MRALRLAILATCLLALAPGCTYSGYGRVSFRLPSQELGEEADEFTIEEHRLFGIQSRSWWLASPAERSAGLPGMDVEENCPDGLAQVSHYQISSQRWPWLFLLPIRWFASETTIEWYCAQ